MRQHHLSSRFTSRRALPLARPLLRVKR